MIDSYTKTLLTVIAVCLLYLTVKDVVSVAYAQAATPVNIVAIGGVYPGYALPVRVQQ